MGLAIATSPQVVNSPRFESSWQIQSKAELVHLHQALIYQLKHVPGEAVTMIFGREVAEIMASRTNELESVERASQRRRVGTQVHVWEEDVFS
jgi:hypothetical protein